MSDEPVTIDISIEAKAVALFYKTLIAEKIEPMLAHDLAMAYVQSFTRRMG